MSTEIYLDTPDFDSAWELVNHFARSLSVDWQGRQITIKEAIALKDDVEKRILELFQTLNPKSQTYHQMAATLAWVGSEQEKRPLLERQIEQLFRMPNGMFAGVGWFKKMGKKIEKGVSKACDTVGDFWKEHKTEIIVGAAVVAVLVVVIVASTGGAGGGAVAAAGCAALDQLCNGESDKPQNPRAQNTDAEPVANLPQIASKEKNVDQTLKPYQSNLIKPLPNTPDSFRVPHPTAELSHSFDLSPGLKDWNTIFKTEDNSLSTQVNAQYQLDIQVCPATSPFMETVITPSNPLFSQPQAGIGVLNSFKLENTSNGHIGIKKLAAPHSHSSSHSGVPTYPQGIVIHGPDTFTRAVPFPEDHGTANHNDHDLSETGSGGYSMPNPRPDPRFDLEDERIENYKIQRRAEEERAWEKYLAEQKVKKEGLQSDNLITYSQANGKNSTIDDQIDAAESRCMQMQQERDSLEELYPNPFAVPLSLDLTPGERADAYEERRLAYESALAAAMIQVDPGTGNLSYNTYASKAWKGEALKDLSSSPPFGEISIIGLPHQGTIHALGGIANSEVSTVESGNCLYETLDKEFAIQPHRLHSNNLVGGVAMVGLEKISEVRNQPATSSLVPLLPGVDGASYIAKEVAGLLAETTLRHTKIQESIDYAVETFSKLANEIIEIGNPNLKQVHVPFSNGGYVCKEALKQLTPEQRDTIIIIPVGTTTIIEDSLAHKVFNVIGGKDWPSKTCNGGMEKIMEKSEIATVAIIPQTETKFGVSGHYFIQSDYQEEIKNIVNSKIKGKYEVY